MAMWKFRTGCDGTCVVYAAVLGHKWRVDCHFGLSAEEALEKWTWFKTRVNDDKGWVSI